VLIYRELISSQITVVEGISGWMIQRWLWDKSYWKVVMSSFVKQNDDGTQLDCIQSLDF
jgi:hypothetical protein